MTGERPRLLDDPLAPVAALTPAAQAPASIGQPPAQDDPGVRALREHFRQEEKQRSRLMLESFRQSMVYDPAFAANVQRLAPQLGMAPEALLDAPADDVQRLMAVRDLEQRDLARSNPILARQLEDPAFARIAHDDLDNLGAIEAWFTEIGRNYRAGQLTTERGFVGHQMRLAQDEGRDDPELARQFAIVQRRLRSLPGGSTGFVTGLARTLGQLSETAPAAIGAGAAAAGVAAAAGAAVPFIEEVITLPTAFSVGFFSTVGVQSSRIEGGNAYVDMLELGYDRDAASRAAVGVGILNGLLETAGVGFLTAPVRWALKSRLQLEVARALADRTVTRRLLRAAGRAAGATAGEIGTELGQELSNIAGEIVARSQTLEIAPSARTVIGFDQSWRMTPGDPTTEPQPVGDIADRLVEIVKQTLYGTALLGAAGGGTGMAIESRRAAAALAEAERLGKVAELLQKDKVAQRDDAAAGEFFQKVADGAGAPAFYFDAEALQQALDKAGVPVERLAERLPGLAEKVAAAPQTGGLVEVPAAEFRALARSEVAEVLLPHVKVSPEAMSRAQAEEFFQTAPERAREARAEFEQSERYRQQFDDSAARVEADRAEALGALSHHTKLTKAQAKAEAVVFRTAISNIARQLGILPHEVLERFGNELRIDLDLPDLPADFLGQFAGTMAATADMTQLRDALQRLEAGEDPNAVRRATGWFRGLDTQMRFEIDDSEAQLHVPEDKRKFAPEAFKRGAPATLGEILTHEKLFEAYPELRDLRVFLFRDDPKMSGYYDPKTDAIGLNVTSDFDGPILRTLMHEVQHAIQEREGFARGGDWRAFSSEQLQAIALADLVRQYDELRQEWPGAAQKVDAWDAANDEFNAATERDESPSSEAVTRAANVVLRDAAAARMLDLLVAIDAKRADPVEPYDAYRRLHGEVEARATAQRTELTAELRRDIRPEIDFDVPAPEVILTWDGVDYRGPALGLTVTDKLRERAQEGLALFQRDDLGSGPKGRFSPRTLITTLTGAADLSTVLHEDAHYFLTIYGRIAAAADAPAQMREQFGKLLQSFGVDSLEAWDALSIDEQRRHHEAFALNFEAYMAGEGHPPNAELRRWYDRFASWLRWIYRAMRRVRDELAGIYQQEFGEPLPDMTPEVREFFDRLVAGEEYTAEHAADPMFADQAASGMSDQAWNAYREDLEAARAAAATDLARQSVREWRALKRRQAEVRRQLRPEVTKQVAAEPIYRAEQLLRRGEIYDPETGALYRVEDGEVHQLDIDEVRAILGIPRDRDLSRGRAVSMITRIKQLGGISAESWDKTFPGERRGEFRIKGVVRRKGGRPWDHMAAALQSDGYGPQSGQEVDEGDFSWFVDAMADAAIGMPTYREEDYARAAAADEATAGPNIEPEPDEIVRRRVREERARRDDAMRVLRRLGWGKHGMLRRKGLSPDTLADMFQFRTGTEFVQALVEMMPRRDAINDRLDELARERHPELFDDEQRLAVAVENAIYTDARQRLVMHELRHLSQMLRPTRDMHAEAKATAEQLIAGMPIGQIRPHQHILAERRARRDAANAAARGDMATAAKFKRQEVLQQQMFLASQRAREEIARGEKLFARLKQTDAQLGKLRDVDVIGAARAVLAANGLGPGPRSAAPHLENVQRYDPELAADLGQIIAPVLFGLPARGDLLLAQYRDIVRAVDALWRRSRESRQIEVDGERREEATVLDELLEQIERRHGALGDPAPRPKTKAEKRALSFGSIRSGLRHVESWALEMDGGKPGPFHTYLYVLLREAYDRYQAEKNELVKSLFDRLRELDLPLRSIDAPELGHAFQNKAQLLGALLDIGNESNLRKLLLGFRWVPDPAERGGPIASDRWWRFLDRMMADGVVTKADLDFCQHFWDLYEERLEREQQVHKAVYGYRFEVIPPRAIQTPFGIYRGGYVPAKADPLLDIGARLRGDENLSPAGDPSPIPTTGRGFAISRVEVYLPLQLDIRKRIQHFDEHLRFLHMQQPGRQILRLLRNPQLARAIHQVDENALGEMFFPWLRDTLKNRIMQPGGNEALTRLLTLLRGNTGLAYMFANIPNAMQQLTGIAGALLVAPLANVRASAAAYFGDFSGYTQRVLERSEFMSLRLVDKIGQVLDDFEVVLEGGWLNDARAWTRRHAYFAQRFFQTPVDLITWGAAYDHAIETGASERQAVRAADAAVRRTQSSGTPADISKLERGGPIGRLLTQFGTVWFTFLNLILERHGAERVKAIAIVTLFMGVGAAAITKALRGGWKDSDDDGAYWDDITGWALGEAVQTAAAVGAPVIGPAVTRAMLGEFSRGRLSFGATLGAVESALRVPPALYDLATEGSALDRSPGSVREWRGGDVRDIGTALTLALGLPVLTVAKPMGYELDVQRGAVEPQGVLGPNVDYWRGLLTGVPSESSRR